MQAPEMTPGQAYAYYEAILFERDRKEAMKVINDVTDMLTETFMQIIETLEKSSGLIRPEPVKRLQWYRVKPQILWEEQQMKFPRDWEEDWTDYQNLRQRAMEGDFGIVEQAAETLMQAQQDLAVYE